MVFFVTAKQLTFTSWTTVFPLNVFLNPLHFKIALSHTIFIYYIIHFYCENFSRSTVYECDIEWNIQP